MTAAAAHASAAVAAHRVSAPSDAVADPLPRGIGGSASRSSGPTAPNRDRTAAVALAAIAGCDPSSALLSAPLRTT
jgi:hypothetical protein